MIEEKLKELSISLPQPAKPLAAYIPGIKIGNKIMTSGQVPLQDGVIKYKGKIGRDLTEEEGRKAAEICVLNCLSIVKDIAGNLDSVDRIVKLTVFVNSAEGFTNQPEVANGASELVEKIFGEKGKHVRSAVGVYELPRNSAVEIEMTVSLV